MSFLDIYQQKQQAGLGQSFTDQANALKSALQGKETGAPAVKKSQVAEDVAQAQNVEQQKGAYQQAQQVQQKGVQEYAQIEQQKRLTSLDFKQKESDLVTQAQRQADSIYNNLATNFANLGADQKAAQLAQLEFLHNLTDRKYVDKIQLEGDKRRLDDQNQLKTAILYATFDNQMAQLNSDLEFKKALAADERTFNEYLATIDPRAAIKASLIEYSSKQSQAAAEGMASGVVSAAQKYGETYKPNPKTEETT